MTNEDIIRAVAALAAVALMSFSTFFSASLMIVNSISEIDLIVSISCFIDSNESLASVITLAISID
jgi:hypothetical protein